jgi:hypothetical protein
VSLLDKTTELKIKITLDASEAIAQLQEMQERLERIVELQKEAGAQA